MKKGKAFSQLPNAAEGESWVLAWMVPAVRDQNEFGGTYLCAHQKTSLIKSIQGNFSPIGLGTIQLELVDIHGRLDGGKLAGALAGCTHLGDASFLGHRTELNVPDKTSVKEAIDIEQTLQALSSAASSRTLNFSPNVRSISYLPFSIVMPNGGVASNSEDYPYGLAFVPKSMTNGMVIINREHALKETHDLCDLLGTKHNLMRQLGFDLAITLDTRLINNRTEYEEAQRHKGLSSMAAARGRY